MRRSTHERLHDIAGAIGDIRSLLSGRSYDDLSRDRVARAAFERFLEVLSEASRHVPEDLKRHRAEIPWRRVADLGNWLRHAYDGVDPQLLWQI
jgi:uncharacterized protein with HEPN domain